MRRLAIVPVLVVFAYPATAGAAPALRDSALNHRITQSTSANWSGYAATGARFRTVSATWKQPAVSCRRTDAFSSFWAGLDGDGSRTVEQIGTDSDCRGGRAVYFAWFEMFPKLPVRLSMAVRPGDRISASVTTDGAGRFTLRIRNATTGGSFTTRQTLKRARLASAEVIAEAPSSSSGVLPLANFGRVHFSAARVNGRPIGTFNPDRIDMASGSAIKASTSPLSGGTSFSVTWRHA